MPTPPSPEQQKAELERLKFMMEQLPDQSYPINPPPIMDPKVITFPPPVPTVLVRYLLVSKGDWLVIVDTERDWVFGYVSEADREHMEELIRLANRPEQEAGT